MDMKKFLTYEEQIELLKNKKLVIDNKEDSIKLLKRYSYFNLINGYKEPFKRKDGDYKKKTTFSDIFYLFSFDDEMRHILMKYIFIIELHIKSLLSYTFCEKFGEEQRAYCNANNYNYTNPKIVTEVNKLVQKLQEKIDDAENINYMNHQLKSYGNIPLWVLVKSLTFGNVSKMYSLQLPEIQSKICHEFPIIRENDLEEMLDILTRYRNVCAHNERLYDFNYRKKRIKTNIIHKFFHLEKCRTKYTTLFDVIIILKFLLPKDKFSQMIKEINKNIETLFQRTNQIQKSQLFSKMGFPVNWHEIENLNPETLKIT